MIEFSHWGSRIDEWIIEQLVSESKKAMTSSGKPAKDRDGIPNPALDSRFYSASALAALQLPGFPWTPQGVRKRAQAEGWPTLDVRGRGGRSGVQLLFAPPADVLALIQTAPDIAAGAPADADLVRRTRKPRELADRTAKGGRQTPGSFSTLVGERMRLVRGALTVEEFADLCEVPTRQVIEWERGERLVEPWVLMGLYLERMVNPWYVLAGIDSPFVDNSPKGPAARPEVVALLADVADQVFVDAVVKLSEQERREVFRIALVLLRAAGVRPTLSALKALQPSRLAKIIRQAQELYRWKEFRVKD